MTRSEAIAAATRIADDLERDLELCSTRDEHMRVASRLADARALVSGLGRPPA